MALALLEKETLGHDELKDIMDGISPPDHEEPAEATEEQ
jgi:hypothetical protein